MIATPKKYENSPLVSIPLSKKVMWDEKLNRRWAI